MSLLTGLTVKNSHILARIYFSFLEKLPGPNLKSFTSLFSYQVRKIFTLFCKLVALIVKLNRVKGLRSTKIVKQIRFKGIWD